MKYEWRKEAKALYQVKAKPTIFQVPSQSYIVIDGKGDRSLVISAMIWLRQMQLLLWW